MYLVLIKQILQILFSIQTPTKLFPTTPTTAANVEIDHSFQLLSSSSDV